jgi:hypothetical protein
VSQLQAIVLLLFNEKGTRGAHPLLLSLSCNRDVRARLMCRRLAVHGHPDGNGHRCAAFRPAFFAGVVVHASWVCGSLRVRAGLCGLIGVTRYDERRGGGAATDAAVACVR